LGHVCIQLPSVMRSKLAPKFIFSFNISDIITVCKISFARALTLSLHQLVLLGFVGFASGMTVGSVSVFQFAYNLQSVPLAIIGVSYSVAAFPLLAQLYAEKKYELLGCNIANTLKHIFFWSFPAIAFFVVILKFIASGSSFTVKNFNVDFPDLDPGITSVILASTLGSYISRRWMGAKYKENENSGENAEA